MLTLKDAVKEAISEQIECVSLDIFDTLVLRTVRRPIDVFSYMFYKNRSFFPEYIDVGDWVSLRVRAESVARGIGEQKKNVKNEVTLLEIYEHIPELLLQDIGRAELMELETQAECDICYINGEVYSFIQHIKHDFGKRVVLISDMYLSREQIVRILVSNGLNISLIDGIFVSSEFGVTKRCSELYYEVLKELELDATRLLHIGDNYISDIGSAKKIGIKSLRYNMIPDAVFRNPFLIGEGEYYGDVDSMYSLRILAEKEAYTIESETLRSWFKIGAMIMGPFCTLASEWIINSALETGIKTIRPLMREGELITKLLKNVCKHRGLEMDIKPLYVSRFSVFSSNFGKISEKDIMYLLRTQGITVGEVFDVLNIVDYMGDLFLYKNELTVSPVVIREKSLFSILSEYLTSPSMIELIRKCNSGKEDLLTKYLAQMEMFDDYITVDLGWRGFIQNAMDKVINRKSLKRIRSYHLLMVSRNGAVNNVVENTNIRGFIGNFGSEMTAIGFVFDRVMELMFSSFQGTTVGYHENESGEVFPTTKIIPYPNWQIDAVTSLQDGILAFQRIYLNSRKQSTLNLFPGQKIYAIHLLNRLFSYPTKEEAELLGGLVYDQNFGANDMAPIISNELLDTCKMQGMRSFYSRYRTDRVSWYSGLNSLVDPAYYLRTNCVNKKWFMRLSMVMMVEDAIRMQREGIVIIGAGKNGRSFLGILSEVGKKHLVRAFVDNDEKLWNTEIGGVTIFGVEKEFGDPVYLCSLIGKSDSKVLKAQILKTHNKDIKFIAYHSDV